MLQRENEIARLRSENENNLKLVNEIAELKSKNDEKESTIKNNEQGKINPLPFCLTKLSMINISFFKKLFRI